MPQIVIHNGNVLAGYASMEDCAILVEDGRISDVFSERRFEQKRFDADAVIIDVEGAEQFVDFRQMPGSVNKIIIELHPNCIGHAKTYQIVADLVNLGFRVEREEGGTFLFLRS